MIRTNVANGNIELNKNTVDIGYFSANIAPSSGPINQAILETVKCVPSNSPKFLLEA